MLYKQTIPSKQVKIYTNYDGNQKTANIDTYHDKNINIYENDFLGSFILRLPPAPLFTLKIFVKFKINENGILSF